MLTEIVATCGSGHKMTKENTYKKRKHGRVYDECKTCRKIRGARTMQGIKRAKVEREAVSKMNVLPDSTDKLKACPNCKAQSGWKRIGQGNEYEDAMSCVYCGWRPNAKMVSL